MEVTHNMYIVKCSNSECKNLIRLSEGKFDGGINDSGGIIIQCDDCKTVFPCGLKNPMDASGISSGGKVLDKWIDNFPEQFENKYNIKKDDVLNIESERLLVFGYEKPPKISWSPSTKPVFGFEDINFEELVSHELNSFKEKINENYGAYYHQYVKGRDTSNKSFVFLYHEHSGVKYQAVFAKEIDNEDDLNADNLYLIHHSKVDLVNQIDGIYSKTQCLGFLERFLNRWRYTTNEVLLVVPFIGYHYKNSQEALTQLWNWLEINLDVNKTNLITRKGTFNLFKKAQDSTGIPFDLLVEWGLLEPLIETMNNGDMPFFQRSHAKYYVGVFDDYVEVLAGSFNIHHGPSFENISFRQYKRDFFEERYLHMFKDFSYASKIKDENVHYMILGTENDENYCENLDTLKQMFETEDK